MMKITVELRKLADGAALFGPPRPRISLEADPVTLNMTRQQWEDLGRPTSLWVTLENALTHTFDDEGAHVSEPTS